MCQGKRPHETGTTFTIGCTDGQIAISAPDLQRVFDVMPTLESLLLGHKQMKTATVEEPSQNRQNSRVLRFAPEWNVSRTALARIFSCALDIDDPPSDVDDQAALYESLRILGGWDVLRRIQENAAQREECELKERAKYFEATDSPRMDYRHVFEWLSIKDYHEGVRFLIDTTEAKWEYMSWDKSSRMYHFRRERDKICPLPKLEGSEEYNIFMSKDLQGVKDEVP